MDLNNFGPFSSAVWGTVSEWIMAAVTAITAFYLYKTLKSQQELTRIEQFRHRESLKPIFTMETLVADDRSTDTEKILLIKIQLTSKDNNAYNVDLSKTSHTPGISFTTNYTKKFHLKKGNSRAINVIYTSQLNERDLYMGRIDIQIQYSDADYNHYRQEVQFQMLNTKHFKTVNLPEYIPTV